MSILSVIKILCVCLELETDILLLVAAGGVTSDPVLLDENNAELPSAALGFGTYQGY